MTSRVVSRRLARLLARAKPMVPPALLPMVNVLRSVPGSGPLVGLPAFRRVLLLAAHPDDESIGCAGTVALLAEAGAQVTAVFATDGEATIGSALGPVETGVRRAAEARAACAALGVQDVRFLSHPDGALPAAVETLGRELSTLVGELRPQVVLLPWFLDGHPDHQALSTAHATATLPANRLVDITAAVPRKQAALNAHVTAHLAFDVSAGLALSRWRSIHGLAGVGYAEAFLAAPAAGYLAMAREART